MQFATPLPIDAVLDDIGRVLVERGIAVLVAPPGAGKTTRVPLALMDAAWTAAGKILVLEPRRIAARAAAERMAATLSEGLGQSIGLRARLSSKTGPKARVEVVTEGVFTRMILDDPELAGVSAVLFDEFHERSLDADLGLALALEARDGLRPDLRLLVMSATLDGARVAKLLGDAPVIQSQGRAYPVEARYLGRSPARIEDDVTDAILRALKAETGSVLAFLPGQGEIVRTAERLAERISDSAIDIAPLYGALGPQAQDLAIEPARAGCRKVVLATSIAETSITIEGVRVIVDSGLQRVPRFEPDVGVTRLVTVRVARAAADQRMGRAGEPSPVSATGCGASLKRKAWSPLPNRKSNRRICRGWFSIARNGARAIRRRSLGSIHRRLASSKRHRRSCAPSARSMPRDGLRRKAAACGRCRCRRAWLGWCSLRRGLAKRLRLRKSQRCSSSEVSAATMPISIRDCKTFGAIARGVRTICGAWRADGQSGLLAARLQSAARRNRPRRCWLWRIQIGSRRRAAQPGNFFSPTAAPGKSMWRAC